MALDAAYLLSGERLCPVIDIVIPILCIEAVRGRLIAYLQSEDYRCRVEQNECLQIIISYSSPRCPFNAI